MAQTIGEILRKTRLARELTIVDVSRETHIRAKYIEALENDQLDSLPSRVHGKGFLRMLADALEIPSEPLLAAWDSGIVHEQLDFPQPEMPKQRIAHSDPVPGQAAAFSPEEEMESPLTSVETSIAQPTDEDRKAPGRLDSGEMKPQITDSAEANAIFLEIGQRLKKQRESLGLSLNDIEHYTHIRMYFLQSIEAGRINELPSTIQGKGMIESYAQFLDIDADAIMLRYADGLQAKRAKQEKPAVRSEQPARSEGKARKQPGIRRLITPDLLIGSLVIISLVIFAVWSTSKVIASRNQSAQETIPAISEMLAATSSGTPAEEITEEIPAGSASEVTSSEDPVPGIDSTPTSVSLSNTEAATVVPFTDNLPVQVYIIARQRAYLKVIVDEVTAFDGRITPGNALPFSGNESVEVITGNAAALQILFNQNDLGTIGAFGQVVDLILTQQGVITPTPRFTPTATQTVPATITLEPTATPETPTITPLIP